MTWEEMANWLQDNRFPLTISALDHDGYVEGYRWMASINGEGRRYGRTLEEAVEPVYRQMKHLVETGRLDIARHMGRWW